MFWGLVRSKEEKIRESKQSIKESLVDDIQIMQLKHEKEWFESYCQNTIQDKDEASWRKLYGLTEKEVTAEDLDSIRTLSRRLYERNPNAKAAIRNIRKYAVGSGFSYSVSKKDVKNDELEALMKPWWEWYKVQRWRKREKECCVRLVRDGEYFLRFFNDNRVRFLEPEDIRDPQGDHTFGIETDPNDVETPVNYYWMDGTSETEAKKIPAAEIIHVKANVDMNVKRGLPELFAVFKRIKSYEKWLDDRMILNKLRTAIGIIREHSGTSSQIQDFSDKQVKKTQKSKNGNIVRREPIPAGAILDVKKGTKYTYLEPKINAPDVKDDGRNCLLGVAAGVGQAEYMVSGDASNSNYASTLAAEAPATKTYIEWQDDLRDEFLIVFEMMVKRLNGSDNVENTLADEVDYEVQGVTIISRNELEHTKANDIKNRSGVLSKRTWSEKEDLDYDIEQANINLEEEDISNINRDTPSAADAEPVPKEPVNKDGNSDDDLRNQRQDNPDGE